jgi:molybdenum cofactor biosynthesis enzyme
MEAQLKFVKKTAFEVSMKVVVKLEDITPDEIEALFKLELL